MKRFVINTYMLFLTVALWGCGGSSDSQEPTPAGITISVSPESVALPAAGGSTTVTVTTTGKEWGAYADESFVSVSTQNSTSSTGTLTVKAEANPGKEARTATVTVMSGAARKTISVVQGVKLQLTTDQVYSMGRGETLQVGVITSSTSWTATTDASWIKAERSANAAANTHGQVLDITTQPNTGLTSRTAKVTVTDGTETAEVVVRQESGEQAEIKAPEGYKLVWNDEFDKGTTLGSDWTHEVKDWKWVNNELQYYRNGEADGRRVTELVDGKLNIHCFKGSDGRVYSGRVYAKANEGWKYGYIEARIMLPKGKGTWPAFWMMPVNFRSWPADGEIDIMEEVGANANYVSSSLHANAHVHSNNTQVTHEMYCEGAEDEFHVYAIRWTHENITTYVDGKVQLSYDNRGLGRDDWPYDDPFYVILNLAWGGDWGGYRGIDESALPATMKIDYVRVFQK